MRLYKSDLENIGHTFYNENEFLTVVSYNSTANIEEILLREILKVFGNYRIISVKEAVCECCGEIEIVFVTNLPVRLIQNMIDSHKD